MKIVLSGSIAFDYLMTFPGLFKDHILPDKIDSISLSFLVDSLVREPGGIAANIAYTLALLGERPTIMATVGEDYVEHRAWLEERGVDTSGIKVVPDLFTASFFVNTDQANAQIASFYPGAMSRASELSFADLPQKPELAVISPNDPGAMVKYGRECVDLGIPYLYDPSQQIVRLDAEQLEEGIQNCTMLFCNDYEFGLIQDKTGLSVADILSNTELVLITCGEKGANLYFDDIEHHTPVIPPDKIADPTGVGDAFRGGFLKGYLHNLSMTVCTQMGTLAATYCLESEGPQGHEFTIDEFRARFRSHFTDHSELDQLG